MNYFKVFLFIIFTIVIVGCGNNSKWEYKIYSVSPEQSYDRTGYDALKPTKITISQDELNKLGAEGWELATSFLELETAHPNFGNSEYVTGLQPNVRNQRLVLIFKRIAKN
ncbi:MAG TPA: DUF4177 domain-containing protein [Ignavibacteriaceae bacterium]|nr:DUF4177 domain-containing protein [Ignavibacteriaceae bacterium]